MLESPRVDFHMLLPMGSMMVMPGSARLTTAVSLSLVVCYSVGGRAVPKFS